MKHHSLMHKRTRLLLAIAALSLLLVYVFPIWSVTLEAPQYPEGIGMEIWINTVEGQEEHDLKNINGLNHYIGMKPIEPDAIPELRYMPWMVGGLIVLGVAAAISGRRWALYAWAAIFLLASVAGIVDFYLWGYDYGHDLNPDAAIKIPGMAYQPPLIGSKQMLNITAHSWPATGGIAAMVSCAVAVGLSWFEWRRASSGQTEKAPSETSPKATAQAA